MLEAGAHVNARRLGDGLTALMVAASRGRAAEVELLLLHGADAEMAAGNGLAAVDFAEDHQGRLMFLRCEEPGSHGGDRADEGREGEEGEEGEGKAGEREDGEGEEDEGKAGEREEDEGEEGEEEADASSGKGNAHVHEGSWRRGPRGRAGEMRRKHGVLTGGQGEGGAPQAAGGDAADGPACGNIKEGRVAPQAGRVEGGEEGVDGGADGPGCGNINEEGTSMCVVGVLSSHVADAPGSTSITDHSAAGRASRGVVGVLERMAGGAVARSRKRRCARVCV